METRGLQRFVFSQMPCSLMVSSRALRASSSPERMLLVCDNASVHKADDLQKLMEQYGIILMFLPPNMTQWMQSLDRVVCGLIKIVHRAPRVALGS
jgi:hypothetical protein